MTANNDSNDELKEAGKKITPCCKRDKPLWIGIILTAVAVILIFSIQYIEFPQATHAQTAMWLYYISYGIGIFGAGFISFLIYVGIKEYCKTVKEGDRFISLLVMACIGIIVVISIIVLIIDWIYPNYVDALFYSLNDEQRVLMINEMDCHTYMKFYDKEEDAYVFFDIFEDREAPAKLYYVPKDCEQ